MGLQAAVLKEFQVSTDGEFSKAEKNHIVACSFGR